MRNIFVLFSRVKDLRVLSLRLVFGIVVIITSFSLIACSSGPLRIYKRDIKQGNYVTQDMVNKLEKNLTKHEVQRIMGSSTLTPIFEHNRWDYDYRFISGKTGLVEEKLLSLYFKNSRLNSYAGDWEINGLPKK